MAVYFLDKEDDTENDNTIPRIHKHNKFTPDAKNIGELWTTTIDKYTDNLVKEYSNLVKNVKLSSKDKRILQILDKIKKDKRIVVKAADKNLGLVVMNTQMYIDMCLKHLKDTDTYGICSNFNPDQIFDKLTQILDKYHPHDRQDKLGNKLKASLLQLKDDPKVRACVFYCLPKVHKDKIPPPGRPIASAINTVTYHTSKYLVNILGPVAAALPTVVNSADQFTTLLPEKLNQEHVILCADVTSLYPSIPTIEGLVRVRQVLINRTNVTAEKINLIIDLLHWILTNNFVEFDGSIYLQLKGTAMGTPVAPAYANIVLFTIEEPILRKLGSKIFYFRYIDDICACLSVTEAKTFVMEFNNTVKDIQLEAVTIEKKGVFLDIQLDITADNKLKHSLYQKPHNKYQYITPLSNHNDNVLKNWPLGETNRYHKRCSNVIDAQNITDKFKTRLEARGYSSEFTSKLNPDPNRSKKPKYSKRCEKTFRLICKPPHKCNIPWNKITELPAFVKNSSLIYLERWSDRVQVVERNQPNIGQLITSSKLLR